MPRVRPGGTSWTHGEVSKRLGGRIDLEQLVNSAEELENFQVLETGAFTRRAGTRFLRLTKYQAAAASHVAHLFPFIPANDVAYICEAGEGYIRFHRQDGTAVEVSPGVPVELSTPYATADVPAFKYAPSIDARYIFSRLYYPRVLERYADDVWRLRTISGSLTGEVPPSYEYGTRPPAGATLTAAATTGNGVTLTAGAAIFLASDASPVDSLKGREIVVFAGPNTGAKATIRTVVDPTHVTADIVYPFADLTAIAVTDWKISLSPLAVITPAAISPINTNTTLTLDTAGWRAQDVGKLVRLNGGLYELGAPNDDTECPAAIRGQPVTELAESAAQPGAWQLEEPLWSAANGFPGAGCFGGSRLVTGGVPVLPDRIDASRVNDIENFATGTLDDDSWSFVLRGDRVNGVRWIIETAARALAVGTDGDGFAVTGGGVGDVITPSNVQANPVTSYASNGTAAPIRIGNVTLLVTDSGRRLIELTFDDLTKAYLDPDLLLLSSHLTTPTRSRARVTPRPLVKIALQRSPIRTVWALRSDGLLLVLTYLREQNVVGWARCPTDGIVEDFDIIPKGDGTGDRVWISVVRLLGSGATVRCIEWFDDDGLIYDTLHTDSAVTYNFLGMTTLTPAAVTGAVVFAAGAAAFLATDPGRFIWNLAGAGRATILTYVDSTHVTALIETDWDSAAAMPAESWGIARTDLDGQGHNEGMPVWVVGDGAPQDRFADRPVVAAGEVTATHPAVAFEVGRHFGSKFTGQKLAISLGGSQSEAERKRVSSITVRLVDSLSVLVGVKGKRVKRELVRDATDPLDLVPRLRSQDIIVENLGSDRAAQITIEQDQPLPCTVLYIQPTIGVSGP